jgi:hypothetical protein
MSQAAQRFHTWRLWGRSFWILSRSWRQRYWTWRLWGRSIWIPSRYADAQGRPTAPVGRSLRRRHHTWRLWGRSWIPSRYPEAVDSINEVFRIVRNVHRNAGDEKQIRSNTFSKGTLQLSNTQLNPSLSYFLFCLCLKGSMSNCYRSI